MITQFDHVRISKQAHIDAGGKCISYDLAFPGHSRKTIGVILPPSASLGADNDETLEIVSGRCRIRTDGTEWKTYSDGEQLFVPAHARIEVETEEPVQYVCHIEGE